MIALYAVWYNFVRQHKTIRVSPAIATGLTDHLWNMEDAVMIDATLGRREPYKQRASN
jgi:hypothetical protein